MKGRCEKKRERGGEGTGDGGVGLGREGDVGAAVCKPSSPPAPLISHNGELGE